MSPLNTIPKPAPVNLNAITRPLTDAQIMQRHLTLIFKLSRYFFYKFRNHNLELGDYYSEVSIGIIKAHKKYLPGKSTASFSTFSNIVVKTHLIDNLLDLGKSETKKFLDSIYKDKKTSTEIFRRIEDAIKRKLSTPEKEWIKKHVRTYDYTREGDRFLIAALSAIEQSIITDSIIDCLYDEMIKHLCDRDKLNPDSKITTNEDEIDRLLDLAFLGECIENDAGLDVYETFSLKAYYLQNIKNMDIAKYFGVSDTKATTIRDKARSKVNDCIKFKRREARL